MDRAWNQNHPSMWPEASKKEKKTHTQKRRKKYDERPNYHYHYHQGVRDDIALNKDRRINRVGEYKKRVLKGPGDVRLSFASFSRLFFYQTRT